MMRCWMLTFWGKPRKAELYENAEETPLMWGPLALLAILVLLGWRFMGIQELLEGSVLETNLYCRQIDPQFNGFDTAWPGELPSDKTVDPRGGVEPYTLSQQSQLRGQSMVESSLGIWGFATGLVLAFGLYYSGVGLSALLLKVPGALWFVDFCSIVCISTSCILVYSSAR